MPHTLNNPVSDKTIRERTFEIIGGRSDQKDALGQLIITLGQILNDSRFVGQIVLNCNNGRVNSIQLREAKKTP